MRRLLFTLAFLFMGTQQAFAAPTFQPIDDSMRVGSPVVQAPAALPHAQDGEEIDSVGSGAIPALPLEMVKENGIFYISGGIGDEEKEQLATQKDTFNLRLEIVGTAVGEYVSDVALTLKDAKGSVLLTIADAGPYVYLQVPAGSYVVETTPAASKTLSIKVPATGAVSRQIRL